MSDTHRSHGPAWYERDVVIPEAWRGKRLIFSIERTKPSALWVDGRFVGRQTLLCAPHEYLLPALEPGSHRITVLVNNARPA